MDSFVLESKCSRTGKPVFIQYYKGADGVWTRWESYAQRPLVKKSDASGKNGAVDLSVDVTGCRVYQKYACPHCGSTSETECGAQIKKIGGTIASGQDLRQGDSIVLAPAGSSIKRLVVGLGWDPMRGVKNIDCDTGVSLYEAKNRWDFVSFSTAEVCGLITGKNGAVTHSGDDLTGGNTKGGVDETINVYLDKLPDSVDKISFLVNIYSAKERHQTFGQIENAFISIHTDTGVKLCEYVLRGNYSKSTAIYVGDAYRENGGWSFKARGEESNADDLWGM